MNRFIFGGMDMILITELMSSGYCFYAVGGDIRFNFPMTIIGRLRD